MVRLLRSTNGKVLKLVDLKDDGEAARVGEEVVSKQFRSQNGVVRNTC